MSKFNAMRSRSHLKVRPTGMGRKSTVRTGPQTYSVQDIRKTHRPRVIPAKAGIQCGGCGVECAPWIPAFAGMTP